MRWLVDECVHRVIVEKLRTAGHDVTFVTEKFPSSPDQAVYSLAYGERRLLLTHDLDFGDLLFRESFARASGVVTFRLRISAISFQWQRLQAAITDHGDKLLDRFTTIEDSRVRSRLL